MKQKHFLILLGLACSASVQAQNVGIDNPNPLHKLDVNGTINGNSNAYFGGFVGIGTTAPIYKLQVNNGSMALLNTADSKTWSFSYNSSSNYFYLAESGVNRVVVANGGNVGIGTSTPSVKLSVAGSTLTTGSATVNGAMVAGTVESTGNAAVEGNLTVNNGRGIIRSTGTSQLKYYTREAAFTAILSGHQLSGEGTIGYGSAGFTSAPAVLVGDQVSTGGTVGQLYRVQLVLYGATATSCKARLLNTSPNAVNYDITWNIICIGQ